MLSSSPVTSSAAAMPAGATKPETLHTYIVMVDNAADPAEVASDHKITLDHVYTEAAHGFDADMTDAKAAELGADSRVTSVKQDHVVGRIPRTTKPVPFRPTGPSAARSRAKSNGPEQNPDPGAGPPPASIPAQPPQQINGFTTNAARRLGSPDNAISNLDGQGPDLDVDVAVLDTGVDPYHPDLRVAGGVDCVALPGDADYGWYDRDGHGTEVAGVAAAKDNTFGIVGVAPGARIWSVRVYNSMGDLPESALLCALDERKPLERPELRGTHAEAPIRTATAGKPGGGGS